MRHTQALLALILATPLQAALAGQAHLPLGEANQIAVADTQSDTITASIPGAPAAAVATGPSPNHAVTAADNRTAYVSNTGNDTVGEVDLLDSYVPRNIRVGDGPEHLVLSSNGQRLYVNSAVSSRAQPVVWVLRQQDLGVTARFATAGIAHRTALQPESRPASRAP